MPIVRRMVVGLVGAALMIAVAACGLPSANEASSGSGSQALALVSGTPTRQPSGNVVWGRVPYCSCLADSATANVADALKKANLTVSLKELSPSRGLSSFNLTVSLKELSPRDGWLYFAATFEPHAAKLDQVGAAMVAGGAEVLEGAP